MEELVEFRLVDDPQLPPIMITMTDEDSVKVVMNVQHRIWLSLHRKTIGGSAEALFGKINDMLTAYLLEQRAFEKMDESDDEYE
tara:strand:- start:253 stop:504 length:252 start_codon:yes stop_codon:yes gene_type:complete